MIELAFLRYSSPNFAGTLVAQVGSMKIPALPISLLLVAVISASCTSDPENLEYPEGPLQTIELNRGGGYGFCPRAGEALDAKIYLKDDRWVLESTIAVLAPEGTEASECLDEYSSDCLISETLPLATLTASQLADLQDAVAAVPSKTCATDSGLACDPCVITSIQVDGHDTDGYCCGSLNPGFRASFRELAGVIDGFSE
jgi:hypothetical protein